MPERVYIANAFSLSMISEELAKMPSAWMGIMVKEATVEEVRELLRNAREIISAVGHESTAQVLTQLLGIEVKPNRVQIQLRPRELLVVFQLLERLPEGKVLSKEEVEALIRQGKAKFYLVKIG